MLLQIDHFGESITLTTASLRPDGPRNERNPLFLDGRSDDVEISRGIHWGDGSFEEGSSDSLFAVEGPDEFEHCGGYPIYES